MGVERIEIIENEWFVDTDPRLYCEYASAEIDSVLHVKQMNIAERRILEAACKILREMANEN